MFKFQPLKSAFNVIYIIKLRILVKIFIQCFEHSQCIAIDLFDMLGNE